MPQLLLVSIIWAFSFGLIKRHLVGVDSAFVSAVRLGLAFVVFLPFLRLKGVNAKTSLSLTGIGAVQFGVMYLTYIESFRYLQAYEVALFTITTPILVTLLADAFDRSLRPRALLAALLAVAGTAFVVVKSANLKVTLAGLLLVQLSNAAFALGQVWYRRLRARQSSLRDRDVFALVYGGAFVVAVVVAMTRDFSVTLTAARVGTLLYLGVVASGVGFFLWNTGALRVSAGTLAVLNNLKIPLGVAVSLLFFGETANLPALAASLAVLAIAVWVAEKKK